MELFSEACPQTFDSLPCVSSLFTSAQFSIQSERKSVELVSKNGMLLFVYRDDWFYKSICDPGCRDINYSSWLRRHKGTISEPASSNDCERFLLSAARKTANLTFLDVGTNYGQWVINARKLLDFHGYTARIACFEPGLAGRLAVINIAMHGYSDIRLLAAAVGSEQGVISIYSVAGHTEDNKFINRPDNCFSFPSPCLRLEPFLREAKEDVFVKIDTQGTEPEVVKGMGESVDKVIGVMEFSPKSISSRVKPLLFLEELASKFFILELDAHQNLVKAENAYTSLENLLDKVWNSKRTWCDLFIIGKNHSRASCFLGMAKTGRIE